MPDSPYARRPWQRHYSPFVPPDLPPARASLIDIFERTAHSMGDRPAIHYFDRVYSFAQLEDLASRFAARLAEWGVGRRDRVAVCTQNDPEFAVAVYGAWKRGSIVAPLNPMFKQCEMEYHLRDSGARVLVVRDEIFESQVSPILAGTDVKHAVPAGGLLESLAATEPDAMARVPVSPDDIAYLVYTSGTTGQPKGAMCRHGNVAFNCEVYRRWMQVGPEDGILGLAPLFHITGLVAQMALSAYTGAPLVLFHRFNAAEALRQARRHRTTFAVAAITAYIALMNDPTAAYGDFRSMVKCYSGGAPIAPGVVERFESGLGNYIHNVYGLTESNSPSHAIPLGARAPVDPGFGALSIGLPVPNCDARIVDLVDPSREVPPGEPGELAMRGPMMFAGYWEKPAETARAFHDGYFLTGDVAVMDSEGWFYLVDRKKDMIAASGFKVWPREVEDVLYQHPAVREAAVIGVPDEYRGETVKAVIALRRDYGEPVTAEEIIRFCRERMAAYKYPRIVEFLEELPKTATGKFLRRQLRDSGTIS